MTAITFPFRFNFEQARRQAKDLHRSLLKSDAQAVRRLQTHHPERPLAAQTQLADAQYVVAKEHGFASWAKLKEYAKPKDLYQNEPLTDGQNRFVNGRRWEDQEARLRKVADAALAKCGIVPQQMSIAQHMGNFGYSDFTLNVVTDGQEPSHTATVHYPYDHFALDEVHRQVASMCAWLFALDKDTDLDIAVPIVDETDALCQLIDHRPDGPAAVCTVQPYVKGKAIATIEHKGWDLANEDEPIILPKETIHALGIVLGHIHTHGRTWSRPDGFNRFRIDWMENAKEVERDYWNERKDNKLSPDEQALLEQTIETITRNRKERSEPWGLTCGGFRVTTCVEHKGLYKPVSFNPTLTYQFDDIGWLFVDISDYAMRQAFLDGYLSITPTLPDFLRLVEGALIAARTRRCAYGGKLPTRLIPEAKLYQAGEPFLLGPN